MKRILTPLLVVTILVLSQSIFAAQWRPIAEITDSELKIIEKASRQSPYWIHKDAKAFKVKHDGVVEILLKDGVVKYYASGYAETTEKPNKEINDSTATNNTLTYQGINNLKLQTLTVLIDSFLDHKPDIKKGNYEKSDTIFSQIIATLKDIDLSSLTDSWNSFEALIKKHLGELAFLGKTIGKRYGFQIIDLFSELIDKYPQDQTLKDNLELAIRNLISATHAAPQEMPTIAEYRILATKLLDFYQNNPLRLPYFNDERTMLFILTPDILEKIDNLTKTR